MQRCLMTSCTYRELRARDGGPSTKPVPGGAGSGAVQGEWTGGGLAPGPGIGP